MNNGSERMPEFPAADVLPDPAELIGQRFPRRRVRLIVEADLDPVPGWGNDPADWQSYVQRTLDQAASHYNPTVTLACVLPGGAS